MDNNHQHDVTVENHGSIFLFALHTDAAREFVREHVDPDAMRFAGKLVVEHRFAHDLADGMVEHGLEVK